MYNNKKSSFNHFGQVDFKMSNVNTMWFILLEK
jgi:hypothetical protein